MSAIAADTNAAADVWTEQDTTPAAVEEALRDLLRVRHAANQGLAPARVLNLVVVVDCDSKQEIASRLRRVGRYHASRTILCAVQPGRSTLDARVVMSYEQPEDPAGFGLIREIVEIDMGPDHLDRLQTIVDPVIVSDLPTMVWSPHGYDQTFEALSELTDVVLLDSDDEPDVTDAFRRARSQLHLSYVVDLAWLRTTPWRERLAASFDPQQRRPALYEISEFAIRHCVGASASALLLAGWLCSRLDWEASALSCDRRRHLRRHDFSGRSHGRAADRARRAGGTWAGRRDDFLGGWFLAFARSRARWPSRTRRARWPGADLEGARRLSRRGRHSRRGRAAGAPARSDYGPALAAAARFG